MKKDAPNCLSSNQRAWKKLASARDFCALAGWMSIQSSSSGWFLTLLIQEPSVPILDLSELMFFAISSSSVPILRSSLAICSRVAELEDLMFAMFSM